MVDMAVGEKDLAKIPRIESQSFYILNDLIDTPPCPRVYQYQFPKIDEIDATVPAVRDVRTSDYENVFRNFK
jgi:hypothetical protein